jgi:hypothetical protein
MKTGKFFVSFLLTIFFILSLTSCVRRNEEPVTVAVSTGVYVLNQGSYGANNTSLTYHNFADSTTAVDIFTQKNNRGLGDTGQDMMKYGSKIYIAVYNSSLIEVVDAASGISLKSISMLNTYNAPAYPRCLTSYNGKVYVTLYDGYVARLDTVTFNIEKTVKVGSNPEGIAVANNLIYVSNSGGMAAVPDSTISVIDPVSFTEIRKIKVVINPIVLKSDSYGDLYVISMGNYSTIPYTLQRIEAEFTPEKVTKLTGIRAYNLTIDGDFAYMYDYDYDTNYNVVNKTFTLYDVKNKMIINTAFIASSAVSKTPYSIDVDPVTKDIFIGETDYTNTGKMYCFSKAGILKYTFNTGLNPVKTIFISNN